MCAADHPAYAQDAGYALKEKDSRTGTNIRRELVKNSTIPLDKPYQEFSPADKAALHSRYENIAPGDEPPFPAKGMKSIFELIEKAQAKRRDRGLLSLVADVDSSGRVIAVKEFASPSPEMTRFVSAVLIETPFKPAMCNGQACKMEFPFRLHFGNESKEGKLTKGDTNVADAALANAVGKMQLPSGEFSESPLRLIGGSAPHMPDEAIRKNITGEVFIEIVIAETGFVESVQLVKPANQILSDAVIAAVKQWQFAPFLENNKPVKFKARQEFVFKTQ